MLEFSFVLMYLILLAIFSFAFFFTSFAKVSMYYKKIPRFIDSYLKEISRTNNVPIFQICHTNTHYYIHVVHAYILLYR